MSVFFCMSARVSASNENKLGVFGEVLEYALRCISMELL
jgi:hypothetical protein